MWNPQGIYANFILKQPTIFHGEDGIWGLSNFPGNRIAVLYGSGMPEDAKQLLESVYKSRSLCFIKKCWSGEPAADELGEAVNKLESFQPDTIIAFGGGSVIDGAKLCRVCLEFPYMNWENNRLFQMTFKTHFIVIPTTVGSGAEASSAAVYYSKAEKTKKMLVCHALQPEVVIFDSRYIKDAPESVFSFSLADALAHMIEGFVSNKRNPLAEEMAVWGISAIRQELDTEEGRQVDFMRLQYAGYLGGVVQNHCLVGAAHAIAHQLASHGISHGKAVAFLLPRTIQMNMKDKETKETYEELAKKSGFCNVEDMLCFIKKIAGHLEAEDIKLLGSTLKNSLSDKNFIEHIKSDPGGKGNPIAITDDYINEFIGDIVL